MMKELQTIRHVLGTLRDTELTTHDGAKLKVVVLTGPQADELEAALSWAVKHLSTLERAGRCR